MALKVVKFGGSSLRNPELVRHAARMIAKASEEGERILVVASAMGDTTDELIRYAQEATRGKVSQEELDEIVSVGEILSARILAAALRSSGLKARAITPEKPEWPVVTDGTPGNARVDLQATEEKVKQLLLPIIQRGEIPVVCGFLGKDRSNRLRTLGRGGSDITAFVLSKCLRADETILVTDVDGILSADPRKVDNPQLLPEVTVEELRDLARYGMGKMHPRALDFKDPHIKAKIISYKHGDLKARGTEIMGPHEAPSAIRMHPSPLVMITIVGEDMQTTPGILYRTVGPLSQLGVNIFGVSIGPRSFSLYVAKEDEDRSLKALHEVVKSDAHMKSVTSAGEMALIVCESEKFIDTPGMIAKLTTPLAEEGINIAEMMTSRASISFLIDWQNRNRAFEILKKVMERLDQ